MVAIIPNESFKWSFYERFLRFFSTMDEAISTIPPEGEALLFSIILSTNYLLFSSHHQLPLTWYPWQNTVIIILRSIISLFQHHSRWHFWNASTDKSFYLFGTVANLPCEVSKNPNWLIILFIILTCLLFIPCKIILIFHCCGHHWNISACGKGTFINEKIFSHVPRSVNGSR